MKTKFDEQVICGQDYVALREINPGDKIDVNGFVITNSVMQNDKLGVYKVESIGDWASVNSGVKVGDIVYADRLASFYHSSPVALMEIKNVIAKCSSEKAEDILPLRNTIIVEECEQQQEDMGGFYVASNSPRTGIIRDMDIEETRTGYPFKIGDRVMLAKGGDFVAAGGKKLFIFTPDKIICKIVEK